jgi:SNF2 family DNA or RNA helicase
VKKIRKYDIVLTTYGTLSSEFKGEDKEGTLASVPWLRVILDEAHVIKNPRGRTAKAAFQLRAERRW